jgi:hypothetical protein
LSKNKKERSLLVDKRGLKEIREKTGKKIRQSENMRGGEETAIFRTRSG